MKRLGTDILKKKYDESLFIKLAGWYVILGAAILTGFYLLEPPQDLSPVWLPVYAVSGAPSGIHPPPGR